MYVIQFDNLVNHKNEGCLRLTYAPILLERGESHILTEGKQRKSLYSQEYRPISLNSFFLYSKLKKILDGYIGDKLQSANLSKEQQASTKG